MRHQARVIPLLWVLWLVPTTTLSQALYEPPEGCEAIATLRLPGCTVRQVARCEAGNIVDTFTEGDYLGRAYYSHPSLFLRWEGSDGYVSGHDYGDGAPDVGARLYPGSVYTYSRDVYRSQGDPQPGDTGTEVMTVGQEVTAQIGDREVRVLDVRFEVTGEGYLYRERALVMRKPALTLGVIGITYDADQQPDRQISTIPEQISLAGDPDFRTFTPAPSCLPSS